MSVVQWLTLGLCVALMSNTYRCIDGATDELLFGKRFADAVSHWKLLS
jgi:hypothetical protein